MQSVPDPEAHWVTSEMGENWSSARLSLVFCKCQQVLDIVRTNKNLVFFKCQHTKIDPTGTLGAATPTRSSHRTLGLSSPVHTASSLARRGRTSNQEFTHEL